MDDERGTWREFGGGYGYFQDRLWRVWLDPTLRTYALWSGPNPGWPAEPIIPWPEGMDLEEVKAYTVTLWRLTR